MARENLWVCYHRKWVLINSWIANLHDKRRRLNLNFQRSGYLPLAGERRQESWHGEAVRPAERATVEYKALYNPPLNLIWTLVEFCDFTKKGVCYNEVNTMCTIFTTAALIMFFFFCRQLLWMMPTSILCSFCRRSPLSSSLKWLTLTLKRNPSQVRVCKHIINTKITVLIRSAVAPRFGNYSWKGKYLGEQNLPGRQSC